jgi:pimeloyl-ACP methyl ester carboxylesterase
MKAPDMTLLLIVAALSGCATLRDAIGSDVSHWRALGRIEGRVDSEAPTEGPLVVVLAKPGDTETHSLVGVDTFVRPSPGSFAFAVSPGRYHLGAYEDRNQNGRLDPGEPTRVDLRGPLVEVGVGKVARQDILLAREATTPPWVTKPLDVFGLVARSSQEQLGFSLWAWSALGEICPDLRDERFGHGAGIHGVWQVMDFLNQRRAGIYFLGPYDPDRVPVLFVHGLGGSPRDFQPLIESLDPELFQPWFYFYPSGFPLDRIADHLATLLARLEVALGFHDLAIVAHSMGGLVSRGAILKYGQEMGQDDIRLFITLATPWSGASRARLAARVPILLPASFADMSPSSDYLRWLFHEADGRVRELPDGTAFHLILAFRMNARSAAANDGRVSVATQARLEAQRQAASVRALDVGHIEILASPDAIGWVNQLLDERFRQPGADRPPAPSNEGPRTSSWSSAGSYRPPVAFTSHPRHGRRTPP